MEYGEQITVIFILLLAFWIWLKLVKSNSQDSEDKDDIPEITDFDRLTSLFFSVVIFLFSWYYCISEYGYLFGFGLGWIPSAISAFIGFFLFPYVFAFIKYMIEIGTITSALSKK